VQVLPGVGQSFAITPSPGFHLVDVKVDGVSRGAVTSLTLPAVTADQTVTVSFVADAVATSGDANSDGKVDVSDALKALRIAVGIVDPAGEEISRCDVAPLGAGGKPAPDGKVTAADALLILKKAVGLTSGW
jgi:RecA/RadA recombinase